MKEIKLFDWENLTDIEYQEAVNYNTEHSNDILENVMEEVKSEKKLSRILCKLGHHKYVTFLIAPYCCVPYFCDRCGEKKPQEGKQNEQTF